MFTFTPAFFGLVLALGFKQKDMEHAIPVANHVTCQLLGILQSQRFPRSSDCFLFSPPSSSSSSPLLRPPAFVLCHSSAAHSLYSLAHHSLHHQASLPPSFTGIAPHHHRFPQARRVRGPHSHLHLDPHPSASATATASDSHTLFGCTAGVAHQDVGF